MLNPYYDNEKYYNYLYENQLDEDEEEFEFDNEADEKYDRMREEEL